MPSGRASGIAIAELEVPKSMAQCMADPRKGRDCRPGRGCLHCSGLGTAGVPGDAIQPALTATSPKESSPCPDPCSASWRPCSLRLASGAVVAADTPSVEPAPVDKLATARARIAQKQWPAAIEELKRVNDTKSADWNNLMGYSMAKVGRRPISHCRGEATTTRRCASIRKHKGALEYSGELYLMLGDLPARPNSGWPRWTSCAPSG